MRDFKEEYYGIEGRESSNQETPIDFVDFFPSSVLDVCRQSERLKTTVQKIQRRAEFNANHSANTIAYATLISDRMLTLDSDGRLIRSTIHTYVYGIVSRFAVSMGEYAVKETRSHPLKGDGLATIIALGSRLP